MRTLTVVLEPVNARIPLDLAGAVAAPPDRAPARAGRDCRAAPAGGRAATTAGRVAGAGPLPAAKATVGPVVVLPARVVVLPTRVVALPPAVVAVVVVAGLTVVVVALVVVVDDPVVDVVLLAGEVMGVTQPVWAGLVWPIPLLRSHS